MTEVMEVQQQKAVPLDAVNWFEIPTENLERAAQFYEMLLPELRDRLDAIQMYAPGFKMKSIDRERLDLLHAACVDRRPVAMGYMREDGESSRRVVRPLGLYFWGGVWTLVAWCEMRDGFRMFRVDRMSEATLQDRVFVQKRGQRLADFLKTVRRD